MFRRIGFACEKNMANHGSNQPIFSARGERLVIVTCCAIFGGEYGQNNYNLLLYLTTKTCF